MSRQLRESDVSITKNSHLGLTGGAWEILIYPEEDDTTIDSIHQLLESRQDLILAVFESQGLSGLKHSMINLYEWLYMRGFGAGVRVAKNTPWFGKLYHRTRLFILDKLWVLF